ncbi:tail completion protein gp17 [Sphingomonas sp. TDK1]|uniref:tail completion protein gp17 n=1 Tax=Sphingomonas sp. TDK1 TaxID=453247 RepID=UPI0007DA1EDB|nr:DUF3168 domain-containing protein [Sphingomonas sp. TDK1]OAN64838.1 hypothetical protein A7X12_17530 [Sphingomonas sp. TDK1]
MTPQDAIAGAVRAALAGRATLAAQVNGVFDAPPVRAARPYLLVDEPVLTDWSTKDQDGREVRIAVLVQDSGPTRGRVRGLAADVEAAVGAMSPALAGGWRIVSRVLLRNRVVAEDEMRLSAVVEFRVRMLRTAA